MSCYAQEKTNGLKPRPYITPVNLVSSTRPHNLIPSPRISSIIPRTRMIASILLPQPQRRHLFLLKPHRPRDLTVEIGFGRLIHTVLRAAAAGGLLPVVREGGCGLAEIFPFAPAVEVDEGLHAAPFHDFAG
jgi:hypothetical protein